MNYKIKSLARNNRGQMFFVFIIMFFVTIVVYAAFLPSLMANLVLANSALAGYPMAQALLALIPLGLVLGLFTSIFIYANPSVRR